MDNKIFSIWIGNQHQLNRVADQCDKTLCMVHKQGDPDDKWGMLNPDQEPEVILSVAAFLYDRAAQKLRIPVRNWGQQAARRLPDEKGTISIPFKPQGAEPIVPE